MSEQLKQEYRLLQCRLQESLQRANETVWHPGGKKYDDSGTVRDAKENEPPLANPFHIDKERIVLCKAFRRLKHKTQVFWAPRNDHFRTRLTHTIELAHLGSQIGALLGLNTDLIEAIAYGHDIGHPPFGHAGERSLRRWIDDYWREQDRKDSARRDPDFNRLRSSFQFDHHEWAWKILQKEEQRAYSDPGSPRGLNLTKLVQEGIKNPSLTNDTSLEAQLTAVADDLAWINHDVDDFQQAGINLPQKVFDAVRRFGPTRTDRITFGIRDIVTHSLRSPVRIAMSDDLKNAITQVRKAYHDLYLKEDQWQRREKGASIIITNLMDFYVKGDAQDVEKTIRRLVGRGSTGTGGEEPISFIRKWQHEGESRLVAAVDSVAKMTDTFALELYRYVFSPEILDYHF